MTTATFEVADNSLNQQYYNPARFSYTTIKTGSNWLYYNQTTLQRDTSVMLATRYRSRKLQEALQHTHQCD